MMDWIKNTIHEQNQDPNIVWKASNMHHPFFALTYADYQTIIDDYLPILKNAGYDVHFNGHEHTLTYSRSTMSKKVKYVD